MSKSFVGIDPGLNGGIAVIYGNGSYEVYQMPTQTNITTTNKKREVLDYNEFYKIMDSIVHTSIKRNDTCTIVCIEKQQAMPGQGVTSMFSIGDMYGQLKAYCRVLTGYSTGEVILISSRKWKNVLLPKGKGADKKIAVELAESLYPKCEFRTKRGRLLDGIAEAMLIAHYIKENYE